MKALNLKYNLCARLSAICIMVCVGSTTRGQELTNYLEEIREEGRAGFPYSFFRQEYEGMVALNSIESYRQDTVENVRKGYYRILKSLATGSDNDAVGPALNQLIDGLSDPSVAVRSSVVYALTDVRSDAYQPSHKQRLGQALGPELPNPGPFIRLLGELDDPDMVRVIRPFSQSGQPATVRWATYLALSRLGDQTATDFISQRVQSIPVDDDWVFDIAPDLVYALNKDLTDLLVSELYSDEENCLPGDPDAMRGVKCGYRILELLAPVVQDFPIPVRPSGDLDVDDYEAALVEARTWFSENPQYGLVRQ